jgi:ubiquinone/menaquinone biosynthesis C-methylase UbiE
MSLFTLNRSGGPHDLELSMAGLKLGKYVLQVDGGDGGLIAALAGVVGLSGQACAVVESQAEVAVFERAAARAGVLVEIKVSEYTALPYDSGTFDLAVLRHTLGQMNPLPRVRCLQEVFRILKAGGRCLVIDAAMRGGMAAVFSRQSVNARYAEDGARKALKEEGFFGVRFLAERNGLTFVEGTKPADSESETAS